MSRKNKVADNKGLKEMAGEVVNQTLVCTHKPQLL